MSDAGKAQSSSLYDMIISGPIAYGQFYRIQDVSSAIESSPEPD